MMIHVESNPLDSYEEFLLSQVVQLGALIRLLGEKRDSFQRSFENGESGESEDEEEHERDIIEGGS
jgi:hypothetical protein